MSTQEDGIGSNVTLYPALGGTITSSTNTSPIQIAISGTHNLIAGAMVDIYGHQVNTAANGRWSIIPTGASTFTLTGSTGNGVGGASGFATVLGFTADGGTHPASAQVPSDGDPRNAASVDVSIEALFDRTKRLVVNQPAGGYTLARLNPALYSAVDDSAGGDPFTLDDTGNNDATVWAQVTPSGVGFANKILLGGTVGGGPAPNGAWVVSRAQAGDKIEVDFGLTANVASGAAGAFLYLTYQTPGGTLSLFKGMPRIIVPTARTSLHLHGTTEPLVYPAGLSGGAVDLQLFTYIPSGSAAQITASGSYSLRVKLWRAFQ